MSLNMGSYFQHEMSLKRRKWVDHLSHGDRHERLANTHHRPTEVLSSGHVGDAISTRWQRRGPLRVYSRDIFELIDTKGYSIDFRYPTRDILLTHLKVKYNDADLYILVNHWPSRRGKFESCQPNDTAHARKTVAESCGKIVDTILKIPKEELIQMPEE